MSLSRTNSILNPRRPAAGRQLRIAEVIDAIRPALESIGFEVYAIDGDGFLTRDDSGRIHGAFHAARGLLSAAEPAESDWTGDDGFIEPDDEETMPARRGTEQTRTADTTLTPEEEEWKEQLRPFSRNQVVGVGGHRAVARAIQSYEAFRRLV